MLFTTRSNYIRVHIRKILFKFIVQYTIMADQPLVVDL